MRTVNEAIAHNLTISQATFHRYTADLQPPEWLHRASPRGNCAAWIIGHLVLTERNGLKHLGAELPPLPDGFEARFGRDENCAQAAEFGDVSQIAGAFNEHRGRLIEAVRGATQEQIDRPLEKPHPLFRTAGEFANFVGVHAAMHLGQITMIRRSLGRPPLV